MEVHEDDDSREEEDVDWQVFNRVNNLRDFLGPP